MSNEKELLELKEKVDKAKSQLSEAKGRKEYLIQQLQSDWDCTTVEQANKLLEQMEGNIETLDEQIEEKMEEIKEKYPF